MSKLSKVTLPKSFSKIISYYILHFLGKNYKI